MKFLTLLLLSFFITLDAKSGEPLPNLVVSYQQPNASTGNSPFPVENRNNSLWGKHSSCWGTPVYTTHVEQSNFELYVFARFDTHVRCTPPPPPSYSPVLDFDHLEAGSYTLHYHAVPDGETFPPVVSDYSNYFIESLSFVVLGAPRVVDATSNISILLLILLLFMFGYLGLRRRLNG